MAKKDSIIVEQQPESKIVIRPITVTATENPNSVHEDYIEVPKGHVYIVSVKDGEEIAGSGFFYPEKSYTRFYSDTNKFLVKKKANA
jgi:hypothetical protein